MDKTVSGVCFFSSLFPSLKTKGKEKRIIFEYLENRMTSLEIWSYFPSKEKVFSHQRREKREENFVCITIPPSFRLYPLRFVFAPPT